MLDRSISTILDCGEDGLSANVVKSLVSMAKGENTPAGRRFIAYAMSCLIMRQEECALFPTIDDMGQQLSEALVSMANQSSEYDQRAILHAMQELERNSGDSMFSNANAAAALISIANKSIANKDTSPYDRALIVELLLFVAALDDGRNALIDMDVASILVKMTHYENQDVWFEYYFCKVIEEVSLTDTGRDALIAANAVSILVSMAKYFGGELQYRRYHQTNV